MINRDLFQIINTRLFKGKAIIVTGPRQSGKTTLLKKLAADIPQPGIFLNCDEPQVRRNLEDVSSTALKSIIGKNTLVLIDEAQRVKNIGLTLKLITDEFQNVQLIATGSSSFEIANEINEPLTGRKFEYHLLPISVGEMVEHSGNLEFEKHLEQRLLFGMYPDVINNPGDERAVLENLSGSYLYKDIFSFQDLRKPEILETLLEALALQVASEVSYNELARTIGIDQVTVMRYIDMLEKSFVVFRLRSLSRNLRNELKKSRKIYFYDNGIRNAIISNFNSLKLRNDTGALWENFLVSERFKYLLNHEIHSNRYFWRTTQQQEIDYIEERDGILYAFEFKWNPKAKVRFPGTFLKAYPDHRVQAVSQNNYFEFLL